MSSKIIELPYYRKIHVLGYRVSFIGRVLCTGYRVNIEWLEGQEPFYINLMDGKYYINGVTPDYYSKTDNGWVRNYKEDLLIELGWEEDNFCIEPYFGSELVSDENVIALLDNVDRIAQLADEIRLEEKREREAQKIQQDKYAAFPWVIGFCLLVGWAVTFIR